MCVCVRMWSKRGVVSSICRLPPTLVCVIASCASALASGADLCGGIPISEWTFSSGQQSSGYHVVCFYVDGASCSDGDGVCSSSGGMTVDVHWDGSRSAETLSIQSPGSLLDLENELSKHHAPANLKRHDRIKRIVEKKGNAKGIYSFFSVPLTGGAPERVRSVSDLRGLVLVFEGGAFIWPGVEVGFKREVNFSVKNSDNLVLELTTKSMTPLVIEISNFLDESECNHVIKRASPHVKASSVSHMDHDVGKADTNWRTSSTHFLKSDDDIMRRLDWRVSALTLLGKDHQEPAQVLRYEEGQSYDAHHDFFNPDLYKKDQMVQGLTKKGLFNRLATVFFYLTSVEEGGETNFPMAGGDGRPVKSFKDCSRGVSIQPERGRIIIFYSQLPSGQTDASSLHSGCPVKKGTKWSANKWVWNTRQTFTPAG